MNCKDVQSVLLDYLDAERGTVSFDGVFDEVKEHLATCEKCRLEIKEWEELLQAMSDADLKKPSPAVREHFTMLLQSELNMQATADILKEETPKTITVRLSSASVLWKIAAAFIILLGGIWIGTRVHPGKPADTPEPIAELRKEVKEMKEVVLFSLLDDESASQRLKAVSYAEEMPNIDQKVIDALVSTLNHDKSVNVRLASLYSLARFSDNIVVRDSLIASLRQQTEPLIQVVLINMLAEKKEIRAIAPIRDLLNNKKSLPEVKDAAQKGLRTL
ncbi:MAG TPA: hypothetical protein VGM30_22695 [Puia sp.]|jgi:hypothetical protein